MLSFRSPHLLLMVLLGALLVLASCTPRGGRRGGDDDDDDSATDDDDATGDDDDATGDDDDATGDDDDATGDDDDATGDDDDATGDDDDATGDDDDATGDDDDATGDDDDATGDDDDSTGTGVGPCVATPDVTLIVTPGTPATTTIDLANNGTPTTSLSCSSGGGNNAVISFAVASLTGQVTIEFDHTGGDVQYEVFDALTGSCDPVFVTWNASSLDCVDPIPDLTGTMTFTPSIVGTYVLVISAYEAGSEATTEITLTQ